MKHILIGLTVLFCSTGFSQQIINGFSMPESITADDERFFVSSQGQDFMSKDGDGYISEISPVVFGLHWCHLYVRYQKILIFIISRDRAI